ncbi:MAG TPA: 2-C-methyl-D-erythritol 4-phosphate cytidylyltransferase, partial [Actinomycetota bacterium]
AYEAAASDGFAGSDTAACVERYTEVPVRVVPGDPGNLKVTFPDDLFIAERLLAAQPRTSGHRSRGTPWSMSISSF